MHEGVDLGVHLQRRRPDVLGAVGRLPLDGSEAEGEGAHHGNGPDVQGKLVGIFSKVMFYFLSTIKLGSNESAWDA